MGKDQQLTGTLCLLMGAAIMFGQAAKATISYAPLIGWFLSFIFCILAMITALKADNGK